VNKKEKWILITPAVGILLGFGVTPLIYLISLCVHRYSLLEPGSGYRYVGGGNFIEILFHGGTAGVRLLKSLSLTSIFVGGSLSLEVGVGIILAIALSRAMAKHLEPIKGGLFIPMLIPPIIAGYMFKYLYDADLGLFNFFLDTLGFSKLHWITNPSLVMISVITANWWQWMPFSFLVFFAGISSIPRQQIEAASIDGASNWQQIKYILLPNIKGVIFVVILLRGVELFKTFDIVYALTEGGPGSATMVFSLVGYRLGFKYWEMGLAAAYALFLLIIVNIFVVFLLQGLRKEV